MRNVESVKQKLGIRTSEELFGIEKQPPEQCPKIDSIISKLNDVYKQISELAMDIIREDNIDACSSLAKDIDWYSDNINMSKELNDIRSQIDLLRAWGKQWKDLAKVLINNLDDENVLIGYLSNASQIKYLEMQDVVSE